MALDQLAFVVLGISLTLVVWGLCIQRLTVVLKRGDHHDEETRSRMWVVWSLLLGLACFMTLHLLSVTLLPYPVVQLAYLIAVIQMFYSLGLLLDTFTEGHANPRDRRIVLPTVAALVGVIGVFSLPDLPINLLTIDAAHGVIFIYQILVIGIVNLPKLIRAQRREEHPPLKLRLLFMTIMVGFVIAISVNELAYLTSLATSGSYRPVILRTVLTVTGTLFTIAFFFVPERSYVTAVAWLKRVCYHLNCLYLFPFIRSLERTACTCTDRDLRHVSVWQVVSNPPYQLYHSVIEICDTRKLLAGRTDAHTQAIAAALTRLIDASANIEQTGWQLYPLGKHYLTQKLKARMGLIG